MMQGLVNLLSSYATASTTTDTPSSDRGSRTTEEQTCAILSLPLDVRLEVYKRVNVQTLVSSLPATCRLISRDLLDNENFYRGVAAELDEALSLVCFNTVAAPSFYRRSLSKVTGLWKDGKPGHAEAAPSVGHSWKRFVHENATRLPSSPAEAASSPDLWANPSRASELVSKITSGPEVFIPFFGKKSGGLSAKHLCYNLMFQEPFVLGKFQGITAGEQGIGSGARFRIGGRLATLSPIGSALQFSRDSGSLLSLLARASCCCFLCDTEDPRQCLEQLRAVFSMVDRPPAVTILAFGGASESLIGLAETLGLLAMVETMPEFRLCLARVSEDDLSAVADALNWIVG